MESQLLLYLTVNPTLYPVVISHVCFEFLDYFLVASRRPAHGRIELVMMDIEVVLVAHVGDISEGLADLVKESKTVGVE